jgi:hypothetical protein
MRGALPLGEVPDLLDRRQPHLPEHTFAIAKPLKGLTYLPVGRMDKAHLPAPSNLLRRPGGWPSVFAPLDSSALDPKVAAAIILLMDGRLHRGARLKICKHLPPGTTLLVQRQRYDDRASPRTLEAGPFHDPGIVDDDELPGRNLIRVRVGRLGRREKVEPKQPIAPEQPCEKLFH